MLLNFILSVVPQRSQGLNVLKSLGAYNSIPWKFMPLWDLKTWCGTHTFNTNFWQFLKYFTCKTKQKLKQLKHETAVYFTHGLKSGDIKLTFTVKSYLTTKLSADRKALGRDKGAGSVNDSCDGNQSQGKKSLRHVYLLNIWFLFSLTLQIKKGKKFLISFWFQDSLCFRSIKEKPLGWAKLEL